MWNLIARIPYRCLSRYFALEKINKALLLQIAQASYFVYKQTKK